MNDCRRRRRRHINIHKYSWRYLIVILFQDIFFCTYKLFSRDVRLRIHRLLVFRTFSLGCNLCTSVTAAPRENIFYSKLQDSLFVLVKLGAYIYIGLFLHYYYIIRIFRFFTRNQIHIRYVMIQTFFVFIAKHKVGCSHVEAVTELFFIFSIRQDLSIILLQNYNTKNINVRNLLV